MTDPADSPRLAAATDALAPGDLVASLDAASHAGFSGLSIHQADLGTMPAADVIRAVADSGLRISTLRHTHPLLGRNGPDAYAELIDLAAGLAVDVLALVPGSSLDTPIADQRARLADAIGPLLDPARAAGIRIGLEPALPSLAASCSCLNRLIDARVLCQDLPHPSLGVIADTYQLWWDPDAESELAKLAERKRIVLCQVCGIGSPETPGGLPRRTPPNARGHAAVLRTALDHVGFGGWIEAEVPAAAISTESPRARATTLREAMLAYA